jgi:type IV pilus assembly protein PilB
MSVYRMRLGELLISLKLIDRRQLDEALELQAQSPAPLGSILVGLGHVSEDQLLNALASQMGVSPWRLDKQPPTITVAARLPVAIARTYQVLPVEIRSDLMILAMRNPLDVDAIDLVRNVTRMRIEPVLVDADRLPRAIEEVYSSGLQSDSVVDRLVMHAVNDAGTPIERDAPKEPKSATVSKPVVALVNQILADAVAMGASDVHLEPRGDRVDVRFRVDGDVRLIRKLPLSILPMLTTRLKIVAELDIVEFRVPQDGRFTMKLHNREVDFRVSVLPNLHGGRIVLRVLDKSRSLKKLTELGFEAGHLAVFKQLIEKPYGMILVTGPTGSGKTTTLYAALAELKTERRIIMTCEDPIEYDVDGINQSQVFEKVGLTFPVQLRAILRQDPDIILVGEIRDGETAQTAIRAAMTGHLVLSTLHCNDAPSAVPRLLDMGVDPFLLSTSVIGVMSQRLVRKLCPHCKAMRPADGTELQVLSGCVDLGAGHVEVGTPVGCEKCNQTGYRGRTAVFEIMAVSPQVSDAVAARESLHVIRDMAHNAGYRPMKTAAGELVHNGITTLDEAKTQVFFDDYDWGQPSLRIAA